MPVLSATYVPSGGSVAVLPLLDRTDPAGGFSGSASRSDDSTKREPGLGVSLSTTDIP